MNDQRTVQTTPTGAQNAFNPDEWHALQGIRESYHPGHEFFTSAELAHLRFVRWLHETGRCAC